MFIILLSMGEGIKVVTDSEESPFPSYMAAASWFMSDEAYVIEFNGCEIKEL